MSGREAAEKGLAEASAALRASEAEVLRLRREVRRLRKQKNKDNER